MVEHLGRSQVTGLEVYALAISFPAALPDSLTLPSPKFTCLLAWDESEVSAPQTSAFMDQLLRMGCVYLCCWGQGCERRHDIMDEVITGEGNSELRGLDIVTTWHADDSLEDALDYFLDLAAPTGYDSERCCSALALTVGGDPKRTLGALRLKL